MDATSKSLLLFLALLSLSASLAFCNQNLDFVNPPGDPEQRLQQCRRQCQQQGHGQQQRMQCERRCEQRYQQERQQQKHEHGAGESTSSEDNRDPARRQYEECRQRCWEHRHDEQQRRQCESRCEAQYEEERKGRRDDAWRDPEQRYRQCRQDCGQDRRCEQRCQDDYRRSQGNGPAPRPEEWGEEEEQEWGEEKNPYLFDRESFREIVRTELGHVRVLPNFVEKSKLLLGIANWRLAIAEVEQHAFLLPHHVDADVIYYVAKGSGVITLIHQDKKETHELNRGDIFSAPAGAIVYIANRERKFILIKLMRPISTPGKFEVFYGAGGQASFLRSFGDEILEASFNVPIDRLQRVLEHQQEFGIVRASEEQIRGLSRHTSEGGQWPFGESKGAFNLLRKRPAFSSRRGQLHEADGHDYPPLRQHDIQVSYANLSEGSMIAPFYNSRVTKIAVFISGRGSVQTICPHLSHRGGGSQRGTRHSYRRVRSNVSPGTVVVLPPGHPTAISAARGENLEAVCFEICAENNVRNFLAGRNNVLSKLDQEAMELSFGMPAREVKEVLEAQSEHTIVAGPEERRERGHRGDMPAFLQFAAAFM